MEPTPSQFRLTCRATHWCRATRAGSAYRASGRRRRSPRTAAWSPAPTSSRSTHGRGGCAARVGMSMVSPRATRVSTSSVSRATISCAASTQAAASPTRCCTCAKPATLLPPPAMAPRVERPLGPFDVVVQRAFGRAESRRAEAQRHAGEERDAIERIGVDGGARRGARRRLREREAPVRRQEDLVDDLDRLAAGALQADRVPVVDDASAARGHEREAADRLAAVLLRREQRAEHVPARVVDVRQPRPLAAHHPAARAPRVPCRRARTRPRR